jgi:Na+-driven multidrug efflux pump
MTIIGRTGFALGALAIILFAASEFIPGLLWPCAAVFWAGNCCLVIAFFQIIPDGEDGQ